MFCAVEGPENVGKSTIIKMLDSRLQENNKKVFKTCEPGSIDPVCRIIRSILLEPSNAIADRASFFLFLADRAQHMERIKNVLSEGNTVISDRGSLSTFVYHCANNGLDPITTMINIAPMLCYAQQIQPDIAFICNANFDWAIEQLNKRKSLDRIEQFDEGFHRLTHRFFSKEIIEAVMPHFPLIAKRIVYCPPTEQTTPEQMLEFVLEELKKVNLL